MAYNETFFSFINTPIQYSENDSSFSDKSLEEKNSEIIKKLEIGVNKLNEENKYLRQTVINLENQYYDEILQRNKLEKILMEKDDEINNHKLEILDLNKKIVHLQEMNKTLNDEKTFSLSDSDTNHTNHSDQFIKDIENLKGMLEKYVGNLKPKVEVNLVEVNKLLHLNNCKAQVKSKDNDLLLIKDVLQCYVLDMILDHAYNIFEKREVRCLESDIYDLAKHLLPLLEKISE